MAKNHDFKSKNSETGKSAKYNPTNLAHMHDMLLLRIYLITVCDSYVTVPETTF